MAADELRQILDVLDEASRRGEAVVLATVVRTSGSTYRRPGARMVFRPWGEPVGFVSGGCLEADLAERAKEVSRSRTPHTVIYDMRSPDDVVWGLGLGCDGEVRVLLERIDFDARPGWVRWLDLRSRERTSGALATVFDAAGPGHRIGERWTIDPGGRAAPDVPAAIAEDARRALAADRSCVREYDLAGESVSVFLEVVTPPPALVLFGAGSDAIPLARAATALGWHVAVADHRPAWARADRFPEAAEVRVVDYDRLTETAPPIDERTAVVVLTHHFLHDVALLRHLSGRAAAYVGFLGPRRRFERLVEEARLGNPGALARLHAPVGLDIGAETPEEIALSILAEVRAILSRRRGGFLRDRRAPLHEPLS